VTAPEPYLVAAVDQLNATITAKNSKHAQAVIEHVTADGYEGLADLLLRRCIRSGLETLAGGR
jgi:Na+-translocating ferredoxin:NAD+ oxidoreductase RnfG subunit